MKSYLNITIIAFMCMSFFLLTNCGENDDPPAPPEPPVETIPKVILDPAVTHQEMIGFGGALTWYCDRVTSSPKKNELIDLMIKDLEVDIVRLKNWYYPASYPDVKSPNEMEISWFKQHFDATNELFSLLKQANPEVEILFSSWGPPSSLKSNDKLQEGTLKKVNNDFMYDEYATYWEDVLDNISFAPDYLSIQNEPSYVNSGWETCEWRPTETSSFPGYDIAFDKVYEIIKDRVDVPKLIGPESANLGRSSFGNTFSTFADAIKDKPLELYAYHPYNFNDGSTQSEITAALQMLKDDYNDKPSIMTEFSGMSWFKTAEFIYSTLHDGNSSGYIYWELMWAEDNDHAMIKVTAAGNYELTPYYFLVKHFSKAVDKGYERIELEIENSNIKAVAFMNPAMNKISVFLLNPNSYSSNINFEIKQNNATKIAGWQSTEDDLYKELTGLSVDSEIVLQGNSISTIEIEF